MQRLVRALLTLAVSVPVVAHAQVTVPVPSVSVDPDHLNLSGKKGDTLTATFRIENHASCGVSFSKDRALLKGITIDCSRWQLPGHGSTTCTLNAVEGFHNPAKDRFIATARVADDCKTGPLAKVAEREKNELRPLEEEHLKHVRNPPDGNALLKREEKLREQHAESVKKLDAAEEALKQERLDTQKKLDELWLKSQKTQATLIEEQRLRIDVLQAGNPALKALEAEIAATQKQAQAEIDALNTARLAACDMPGKLERQRDVELAELRRGAWHNKCSRTESEILKETGQTLEEHLRSEGGKMEPVPEHIIRLRKERFDNQIKAARERCNQLGDEHIAAIRKWPAVVRELQAKRPELEKKRAELLEQARADLSKLQENARGATMRHKERLAEFDRDLDQREEKLQEARKALDKQLGELKAKARTDHDKTVQDHNQKGRLLLERIGKLRNELNVLANRIRNAHQQRQIVGVRIDVTFH